MSWQNNLCCDRVWPNGKVLCCDREFYVRTEFAKARRNYVAIEGLTSSSK